MQVSCRTGIGLARATVVLEPLLVLVRHGDVEHGHDVLWGRSPGVTLTAQGRRAIVALTPALRRLRVSRLVTSPCHRAVESAALLSDALGVHVDADAGFDEFDYGAWSGCPFTALAGDSRWRAFNEDRQDRSAAPGGESFLDFRGRIQRSLEQQLRPPTGTTGIVTHAEVVRAIVLEALGREPSAWAGITVPTASLTLLRGPSRALRVVAVGIGALEAAALAEPLMAP